MTVQEEAQWCIQNDGMLAEIRKKIKSDKVTYADTAAYSARAGKMIGALLSRRLPEIPPEEREQLCVELLRGQYIDINAAVDAAQSYMDKALGIRLTPQHPAFNGERAHQIGSSTADPTVPPETQQRRARSATETMVKSMHDDRMKAEAKSRSRLGLDVTIERKGTDCCAWCAEVAGRYPMGEEPEGIFRRHDNCDCTVIYGSQVLRGAVNEKGRRTKTWEEVDPKKVRGREPTRLTRAQAAAIEAEHLPKRLTPDARNGTINAENDDISLFNGSSDLPEEQKESLDEAISVLPAPLLEQLSQFVSAIRIEDGRGYSSFNRATREIVLDRATGSGSIIHELGHAFGDMLGLFNDQEFLSIIADGLDLSDWGEVISVPHPYKPNTYIHILRSNSPKIISRYQLRIYDEPSEYDWENDSIPPSVFQEFISVAFETFYSNPQLLREKDMKLFEYLERCIHGIIDEKT